MTVAGERFLLDEFCYGKKGTYHNHFWRLIMLTLMPHVASVTPFATVRVRVKVMASTERPFAQFLKVLLRALAAVQA
jgi:hypothetical protein